MGRVIPKLGDPLTISNTSLWFEGRKDERVVEYPFALKHLQGVHSVLDVGCLESSLTNYLSQKGFFVVGMDIRKPFHAIGADFVTCDTRLLPFKSKCFDLAIAVSTIEHVGLICYGLEHWEGYKVDPEGDRKALDEMARVAKRIIITLPYGRGCFYWMRVYNQATLSHLLTGYKIQREEYYKMVGDKWVTSTKSEHPISEGCVKGVVCLEVVK